MAYNFTAIEKKWQRYWLENRSFRALDPADAGNMPKAYVLDMFPYPSGAGLHVGHPEGYTATDIVSRFLRMRGVNVLHPIGWDAFGLPAEQHAVATGIHPRINTAQNVDNFRRQIRMLGLSYDWDREVDTTDPGYYKWTQWIFLQLFNSYFDPIDQKAKPVAHLLNELVNENLVVAPDNSIHINPAQEGMEAIAGEVRLERLWRELPPDEQREVIDAQRLAYMDEAPVNWCPALGTVLSNEEVIDGKSERGNFPVERRPMRQWMLRITAYADRLLADLDALAWPESLKEMQRNWIGRSTGAEIEFEIVPPDDHVARTERAADVVEDRDAELSVTVFTTRPDTLYGATYMVLAPEHPLVDRITPAARRESVEAYRTMIAGRSDRDRMADAKEKTGVATGAFAVNPINDEPIPIYIADYVMMGYGTGAIMAVPAHDERDFEFAKKFDLPIRRVILPPGLLSLDEATRARIDKYSRDPDALFLIQLREGHPASSEREVTSRLRRISDAGKYVEIETGDDEFLYVFVRRGPLIEVDGTRDFAGMHIRYRLSGPADFISLADTFTGEGIAINSELINGLPTQEAKRHIIDVLEREGTGRRTTKYKLRDWLFSRQRYWGEPFPILLDEQGNPHALDESELPLTLPEIADFKPTGSPEGPLSKATDWLRVERDGKVYTRETNTMPQWAGSCWYYLRYIDPRNDERFVDPAKERYWMPVDLYVGGVEHAVLHLLYARFWHKVLFDLGHVSTVEPFARLVNQGLILGETEFHAFYRPDGTFITAAELDHIAEEAMSEGPRLTGIHKQTKEKFVGNRVEPELVEKRGDRFVLKSDPSIVVDARAFKMSKSRGNVVNPDDIVKDYGADTFRLYEMYMGPLEAQKPWNTRDIVGMARFLNAVWRNLMGDEETNKTIAITGDPIPEAIDRQMHRTIKKVAEDIQALRFNTAIAELIKLNNEITGMPAVPRELAENLTLMLAPFAPHLAEELWERLGHAGSLARHPWPAYDAAKLVEAEMELPVQVNGKVRDKIRVPADADEATVLQAAEASEKLKPWIEGKTVKKRLYVPKKLVNLVVG